MDPVSECTPPTTGAHRRFKHESREIPHSKYATGNAGRVGSQPEYTLRLRQHPDRDEMGESRQAAAPGRREGGIEGRVTSTHGKRSPCHFRILPLLAAMRKCRKVVVENVKRRGVGVWRSGDDGPVTPTKGPGHPFRPGGKNGGKSVTVKFVSLLW